MRALFPSLKENKRYLLFKIHTDIKVSKLHLQKAINNACKQLIGELGCAKAGVSFIKETYLDSKKTGIIRINTKYVDELKMALGTIKEINDVPATFDVLKISGVINKLK
tara:strand:- start:174 stop:500 length:327 start_codon:yes stop_codon:yes gene_type:complete